MKIKVFLFCIVFVFIFIIMHPWGNTCNDSCAYTVTVVSFLFAFINLSIYNFFIGDGFDVPVTYYSYIKSLKEDDSINNKMIRIVGIIVLFMLNIWICYFIYQNSWVFN
jgi:hypothetical protein